jgi:hypothetical protein
MTQLTLRGFDADLERALRRLARQEGISLNQAALKLLRKGAGVETAASHAIGDALDPFVGSVSDEDTELAAEALRRADAADVKLQRRSTRRR